MASSPLPSSAANRNCYTRNGTLILDVAYQPCSSAGQSACCGTNHDGAGHVGIANDVCDSNGLCQNYEGFDGTNAGVKLWWRQGCTDPTWSSPNCLASVCEAEDENRDGNAPVYSCGDGNWACGRKSYCSTSSRLFTLAATVGREVAASTSTSAASSASSAASTTDSTFAPATTASSTSMISASAQGTATPSPSESTAGTPPLSNADANSTLLSTGAKAGIGVGIAVFALLLGIILFLLHKIKKNRKQQEAYSKAELPGQNEHGQGGKPQTIVYAEMESRSPVEMPACRVTAQEMNVQRERTELATTERAHELG